MLATKSRPAQTDPAAAAAAAATLLPLLAAAQVVDKDAAAVLDEIEATILTVAASILAGNGFHFDIPRCTRVLCCVACDVCAVLHVCCCL